MDIDTDDATFSAAEAARIGRRRMALGLAADQPRRALALSGGGIRSATFALGVLQALARKPLAAQQKPTDTRSILWSFDYLSTVSGGGYIGSFLCSLFVPGRLEGRPSAAPAVTTAAPRRRRRRAPMPRAAPMKR